MLDGTAKSILKRSGVGRNGGIDADQFTVQVYQCPAGITRIHGSIRLNKRFDRETVAVQDADASAFCAHNAGSYR